MIKVTFLGDSIRLMGYGTKVPAMLGEEYEVFQSEDNCRFAQYTLRCLFDWADAIEGSDIIHWNNGLWDVCDLFGDGTFTPIDEYVKLMSRIADILLSRAKKVIFATTTPVTEDNPHNSNDDIIAFNKALVPVLEKKGIIINDLHGLVYPKIDEYIRKDDKIHLTNAGIDACAEQVTAVIRKVAMEI